MDASGLDVQLYPGSPAAPPGAIEVDIGVAVPAAFSSLRKLVERIRGEAPMAIERAMQARPSEWNRLFPGAAQGVPDLSDLALTPSERRLHRESEQTFRVLNMAARIVLDAIAATGRPLVLRNAGQADLVSLRGLMRASEWSRIDGTSGLLVLGEWSGRRRYASALFAERHQRYQQTLRERMRATLRDGSGAGVDSGRAPDPAGDLEGTYLLGTLDEQLPAERRLAFALHAIRACFFSTNHEGAMLAAEQGLSLLDRIGPGLDIAAMTAAWDALDNPDFATPVIELDRSHLGGAETLRALFLKQIGIIHVFTGEHEQALDAFGASMARDIRAERKAQLRMYRALTWTKRLGNLGQARAELDAGLGLLAERYEPDTPLEEGWLRNLYALTYFLDKDLRAAMRQERIAMQCMQGLTDPSAMHLITNLISNISVLQENGKEHDQALTTWRLFEQVSSGWGTSFHKHYTYRRAGLQLRAGQRAEAATGYAATFEISASLGDSFHRQQIASELGRIYLDDGRLDQAEHWYERAAEAAGAIGDPLRLAESMAGLALARRSTDFAAAQRYAKASTTYPREAERLGAALAAGDAAGIQALLPAPRTKLNRPFDLVNL